MKKNCFIFMSTAAFCFIIMFCKPGAVGDSVNLNEIMIKEQIESRGVKDPSVLNAMKFIDRRKFVPDRYFSAAYEDRALPIGYGQTISQPYIVALMTELCELKGSEKVLEIGTGSGYQAAILSKLSKEVYTIEIISELGNAASERLKNFGFRNVHVRIGDGYKGWPEKAPFNVIILTASPSEIPDVLLRQLADGGILVAPVGDQYQELVKIIKKGASISRKTITSVRFVPMVHQNEKNFFR